MRLIAYLKQRLADWRRERRIIALYAACKAEMAAGRRDAAREAWVAIVAERAARSDAQLTRLAIAELRRNPWLARAQMERADP